MPKLRIRGKFLAAVAQGMIDLLKAQVYVSTSKSNTYFGLSAELPAPQTIDARIAKLDEAKERMIESLGAIEELKTAATENKKQLEETLERLAEIRDSKLVAERELGTIQAVAAVDLSAFRKIAGVPSRNAIRIERGIGFVLGVAASLVASIIWVYASSLWNSK